MKAKQRARRPARMRMAGKLAIGCPTRGFGFFTKTPWVLKIKYGLLINPIVSSRLKGAFQPWFVMEYFLYREILSKRM
jgi:hypothetical protein